AGVDPARRHPVTSVCRRHGGGNARAERGGELLSLEGPERADSAGGTANPVVPAGASAGCLAGSGRRVGKGAREYALGAATSSHACAVPTIDRATSAMVGTARIARRRPP